MVKEPLSPTVFETMRTYNGRVRAFDLHFNRLIESWKLINKQTPLASTISTIRNKTTKLISKNKLSYGYFTPEKNLTNHPFNQEQAIRVYLSAELELSVEFSDLDQTYIHRSCSIMTTHIPSLFPLAAKHIARQSWDQVRHELKCDEILLCDLAGAPLETNHSNFWILEMDCSPQECLAQLSVNTPYPLRHLRWYTHPADGQILSGITRQLIITIFKTLGAQVFEQRSAPLKTDQDQVYFLTSTLKSIAWVKSVDRVPQIPYPFIPLLFPLIDGYLSVY
jgi:branched-subunit amino acid aminotransferase/4-amino-4-deoxychorismate lyase